MRGARVVIDEVFLVVSGVGNLPVGREWSQVAGVVREWGGGPRVVVVVVVGRGLGGGVERFLVFYEPLFAVPTGQVRPGEEREERR